MYDALNKIIYQVHKCECNTFIFICSFIYLQIYFCISHWYILLRYDNDVVVSSITECTVDLKTVHKTDSIRFFTICIDCTFTKCTFTWKPNVKTWKLNYRKRIWKANYRKIIKLGKNIDKTNVWKQNYITKSYFLETIYSALNRFLITRIN